MNKHSKIAILGFGVEGRSVFSYLLKHGFSDLTVCDQNLELEYDFPEGVSSRLGPQYLENLTDFDIIFRSPGLHVFRPEITKAQLAGIKITSAIKFFIDQCPCPAIGVTGTKGKGTTSSLIYEMLKEGGKKSVFLGGNIGQSPLDFLDELKGDSLVVLELSSFQIQDLEKSPRYAVILNTTEDHLDYHADIQEYWQAKEKLLTKQHEDSLAVLNIDYPYINHYAPLVKGRLCLVSTLDNERDGERGGAFIRDGKIYISKNSPSHDSNEDIFVCHSEEMALVGSHNLENILPATTVAHELGVSVEDIAKVIKSFKNLPHRLEEVETKSKTVRYFNDSYSTNTQTSIAAIDSFDLPTVLIAGGFDKGLDYKEWAEKIISKPSLKAVCLMGDTTEKMQKAIEKALKNTEGEVEVKLTKNLKKSFEAATKIALELGEKSKPAVVVMSPAASSFDQFKSYKQRGKEFVKLAKTA
jgi:UDP-N-acetylmuramoylalanine--D-glutamate ligase